MEDLSGVERKELRVRGAQVPLLEDVFHMLGDLEVNVEIKAPRPGRIPALARATARVIADSGVAEQVLVSSFHPLALVAFHVHLSDIALAYLFHDEQPLPFRKGWLGQWIGASVLHPQHTLCTETSVRAWHTSGRPINVWTVDDRAELDRLARLGVDGVFCNDPAHAVRVFDGEPATLTPR
jgi:glycerophosphoryl diester phosphodiesterase